MNSSLRCTACDYSAPLSGFPYHCPRCDGILLIEPDLAAWPGPGSGRGLERYRGLLPLEQGSTLISLGEGDTPLVAADRLAAELDIAALWIKNETVNPTGSFKDRALAVMVTRARDEGFHDLVASSSGNAGAATAAYGARAGSRVTILVPDTTAPAKLAQILVYGARVVRVRGSASDTYQLAKSAAESAGWANLTTTFRSPFATAGFKTIGYELVEQLQGRAPDWIIAPISAGPILVAVASAYRELQRLGQVDRVPRMVCAQAAGCAPIVRAFEQGADEVQPWSERPATMATAIADPLVGYAADGTLTVRTVRETNGTAVAVDEAAIREAIRALAAGEGIFAEPAGAVPLAALRELRRRGTIGSADSVVCLVTGHGLKDPLASAPPTELPLIDADLQQLFDILAYSSQGAQEA